ncbi:MAG: hypothetical protein GY806_04315 [Gammaproteobacteria bacterium]|nr:hypothetical protein [Gammaproteobacteria bacterium]
MSTRPKTPVFSARKLSIVLFILSMLITPVGAQQAEQLVREKSSQENSTLQERIQAERVENARLIESAFEQKLIDAGGLLMRPGIFSYEPSFSYANSSVDRIIVDGFTVEPVVIVGDIISEKLRREVLTLTNTFRVGLPKDFQFELIIPYGYEDQGTTTATGEHNDIRSSGLGDISLSISHQLIKSSNSWPDTLINLGLKSKTGKDPYRLTDSEELALGTGFATASLSLTSISVSDPLAFYYGFAISKTPRDKKSIGYIKPGDSLRIHLGSSLAINLDTSMSFGFQISYTDQTEFEGKKIPGSDYTTATLSIGMSRKFSDTSSLEFDVGIGLTEDAPDFQFTVAYPVSFN